MFYSLYLKPFIVSVLNIAIVITFVYIGIKSFGNPLWFDRFYILVMIITVLTCKKNVNILGVVAISVLISVIDESSYLLLADLAQPLKILVYGVIGYFFWCWRYDSLSPLLFIIFFLTITAEIYWQYKAYPAPQINWEVQLIFLCFLMRHCLFRRVWWTERFFPQQGKFLRIDWQLRKLYALQIIIRSFVIVEYILRHLSIIDSIYIYQLTPILLAVINILQLFLIFWQNYQLLLDKLFNP